MDLFQKIEWFEKLASETVDTDDEIPFEGENYSNDSILERKNAMLLRRRKLAAALKR